MAPRETTWQPRKVTMDLYTEREHIRWYWRPLGALSSTLVLLGFLVFPTAFPSAGPAGVTSSGALSIIAVVLLALGYSLSVALWFICSSWLFQFDIVFLPCLFSCVMGLLNVGITLGVHPPAPGEWSTAEVAALVLSLASSAIYAALSYITWCKISNVRSKDRDPSRHRKGGNGSAKGEAANLLHADELQRQHFLRLLERKEIDKNSPSQSTFRIDIPENAKVSQSAPLPNFPHGPAAGGDPQFLTSYMAVPSGSYESRGPTDIEFTQQQSSAAAVATPTMDPRQQALEEARERSAQRQRERDQEMNIHFGSQTSPSYHYDQQCTNNGNGDVQQDQFVNGSGGSAHGSFSDAESPPVIVNTRTEEFGMNSNEIPLAERHPLERTERYVRGRSLHGSRDLKKNYNGTNVLVSPTHQRNLSSPQPPNSKALPPSPPVLLSPDKRDRDRYSPGVYRPASQDYAYDPPPDMDDIRPPQNKNDTKPHFLPENIINRGGSLHIPHTHHSDEDDDDAPSYEIVEGEQIEVDLERGLRKTQRRARNTTVGLSPPPAAFLGPTGTGYGAADDQQLRGGSVEPEELDGEERRELEAVPARSKERRAARKGWGSQ